MEAELTIVIPRGKVTDDKPVRRVERCLFVGSFYTVQQFESDTYLRYLTVHDNKQLYNVPHAVSFPLFPYTFLFFPASVISSHSHSPTLNVYTVQ